MKQVVMSSKPGKVIDCCSDKAICTTTVNFIKCHKITYGLVARLVYWQCFKVRLVISFCFAWQLRREIWHYWKVSSNYFSGFKANTFHLFVQKKVFIYITSKIRLDNRLPVDCQILPIDYPYIANILTIAWQ